MLIAKRAARLLEREDSDDEDDSPAPQPPPKRVSLAVKLDFFSL